MSDDIARILEACRRAEKEQALYYRRLAVAASAVDQVELTQRFQDLHADEQHHLSRITARLIELGHSPPDLSDARAPAATLAGWEGEARARELDEVRRYEELLAADLDDLTRSVIAEILSVERSHASELGGKWTMA